MAIKFKETDRKAFAIQKLIERHEKIAGQIEKYSADDTKAIEALRNELARRWKDFSSSERKLNIAIAGRVKAGKSTFLNTVIFDGKHILPEAFTPKTATLTKIEYAEHNSLEIEYYSVDEWREIEFQARSGDLNEANRAAKELVSAVEMSGIDVSRILSEGNTVESFTSEDELMGRLNRYVGENGEITPLVKCVTLKINKSELDGISIIDTPGLNDPVISRTQKTRDFLGLCDVVFFLSPASQFLDKNDVELLRAQLPQKGVARLILICSRFDDGIIDVIYDVDSLKDAVCEVKTTLRKHATKIFNAQIKIYSNEGNSYLSNLLEQCKTPIFVSSLLHNMIGRDQSTFNDSERNVFDSLNANDDLDSEMIALIGDIEPVNRCLQDVIDQKDLTLAKKADEFIPLAQKNLSDAIANMKTAANHEYNRLVNNDKPEIERQQKMIATRIHTIEGRLEEVFGNVLARMETSKIGIMQDIRRSYSEYCTLATRTGIEINVKSYRVSDSKWYNPFSWGRSHREYYTYETRYSYIDTNDALENIRSYARNAATSIENGIVESIDITRLKQQLLKVVVDCVDVSDESFDPAYFRLLAEKNINSIEMPVINIDVSTYLNNISSRFTGEIRDTSERSSIQQLLGKSIADLFDEIGKLFSKEVVEFHKKLALIKGNFAQNLIADINGDFEKLKLMYVNKENNIKQLERYLMVLENL